MKVRRYEKLNREEWNTFLEQSKNGLFLFHRDYLEYHSERFTDFSLMFYKNNKLAAIMPANIQGNILQSHSGLTFGGIISNKRTTTISMISMFEALMKYAKECKFKSVIYKAIPHVFHVTPAQEDLYAISLLQGKLIRRDLSSVIRMDKRLPLSKGKKHSIGKARKAQLTVKENTDYASFMPLLEKALKKHNATPTHTLSEIEYLASLFPEKIKLFSTFKSDKLLAGAIIYHYGQVAHVQYMAANEEGKTCGAIDLLINNLIEKVYNQCCFFSFGVSTENNGRYLNQGLVAQKEMFGARALTHDFYEISVPSPSDISNENAK